MIETEDFRTEMLVAAVWRATARALADQPWTKSERIRAIQAADHVEHMLRLTSTLWNRPDEESEKSYVQML